MQGVKSRQKREFKQGIFFILLLILSSNFLSCNYTLKELTIVEKIPSIDTEAELMVSGESFDGFYRSCVTISILNPDNEKVEYSIDGGRLWINYDRPFEICNTTTILYRGITSRGKSSPKIANINIDKKPPEILPVIESPQNSEGWNNTDVTVSFICRDNESGIKECPSPVRITEEGRGQIIKVRAIDRVGNESSSEIIINIDRTPPTISIIGLLEGRSYFICDKPSVHYKAEDNLSGIKEIVTTNSGENPVGRFKYMVRAIDRAGNVTEEIRNYFVIYKFEGFGPPLTFRKPFRLGSVIPLKFRLSDGCGNRVTDARARFHMELFSKKVPEEPPEEISDEPLFGDKNDFFTYDYLNAEYVFNLSTDSLFPGIWKIDVSLDDGMTYLEFISIK